MGSPGRAKANKGNKAGSVHVAHWTTGQVERDGRAQKWLLEKMNWMTRKQDLSHVTESCLQSWDGASLSMQSSHLWAGRNHRMPCWASYVPLLFNSRTNCLVLTSCDISPGSTTAALLSTLVFLSYKTPTLGGLFFRFE